MDGATVIGGVEGGENTQGSVDTIDLSLISEPITIDLSNTFFTGIESVIGNNQNSTLIGTDGTNTWNINGVNDGIINGLKFTDFENLVGGAGVDTFNFTASDEVVLPDPDENFHRGVDIIRVVENPDEIRERFRSGTPIEGNILEHRLARLGTVGTPAISVIEVHGFNVDPEEVLILTGLYGRLAIGADGS